MSENNSRKPNDSLQSGPRVSSLQSRRAFLVGTGALGSVVAGAALVGCGSDSKDTKPTAASASSTRGSATATKRGGTLRMGITTDIDPTSMPYRAAAANTWVTQSVWETLVTYRDSLDPQPLLAESWKLSDDATSLTIKLRSGVTYHSGRDFTADDVKFNLQQVTQKSANSQFNQLAGRVSAFDIADPLNLTLHFSEATPNIFDLLSLVPMADKDTLAQVADGKLIGTGPFRMANWQPKQSVELQRFEQYWEKGKPILDKLSATVYPDTQSLGLNLQSGDIDYTEALDPVDADRFKGNNDIVVKIKDEGGTAYYLGINTTKEPMTDPRVRQAINLALNRDRYISDVLLAGKKYVLPWPTYSPAYDPAYTDKVSFNVDEAKKLLGEAGYANGIPGEVSMNVLPTRAWATQIAQILQADLKQIGINLKITPTEYATMLKMLSSGTFDPMWLGFNLGFVGYQPATTLGVAFPIRVPNTSNYDADAYVKAVEQVESTPPEEAERKAGYDAFDKAFVDGAFVLPFASGAKIYGMHNNVQGFSTDLFGQARYEEMSLS